MKNIKKILIFMVILLIGILFYNKEYIYSKLYKNKRYNIAVIIHGYAPRSFKYTYKSIQKNIINQLRVNHNVDVYHYSLLSKDNKIHSSRTEESDIHINNNDVNLLKCNKLETEYQEDINIYNNVTCTNYKEKNMNLNFMRSLKSELECMKRFPLNNYDMCVMVSSDSLILKPINEEELKDSYISNCLYTTNFNQWGGLANGFYIAPPNILYKTCTRYHDFPEWCSKNSNKNAEKFLKNIILNNNVINKDSDMYYLKIRANGKSNHYINLIDNYDIKNKDIIKSYYK